MHLPAQLGLIYLLSETVLWFTRKSEPGRARVDAGSLFALWIAVGAGIAGGINVHRIVRDFEFELPRITTYGLIATFACGVALRWWSILLLGKFFTVAVAIAPDHKLIMRGPYRIIRHPAYTGMMIAFGALAVTFQNWLSLACILVPISMALAYRIRVEEVALIRAFGDAYLRYQATTYRLIPWLY